jgi:hypothetical protein
MNDNDTHQSNTYFPEFYRGLYVLDISRSFLQKIQFCLFHHQYASQFGPKSMA